MRQVALTLAVVAGLGLTGALAVVGLGLYNVSAQVGHLPGISWLLHTTFRNSVRLRAPSPDEVPPLDDPDLIALGARHYATACAPCHGTPGAERSATMRALEPEPPAIDQAIQPWAPNELHWIIQNGVKMTGMPAWPVPNRPDEVWSVVAYLTALKADAATPMPAEGAGAEGYCTTCHQRLGGAVPRLDILPPDYLLSQMQAYRSGRRPSGIMSQAVSLYDPETFADLAAHLADAPPRRLEPVADPDQVNQGAALARRGTRDVPACIACHSGSAVSDNGTVAGSKGPPLHGQSRAFLATQMTLWRDGVLDHNPLMRAAARDLTDDDIAALAAFFATRRAAE